MQDSATDRMTGATLATGSAWLPGRLPRHNWSWFLVRGILSILLGVIAILAPGLTLFAFAMVFAAFSFADGVASLISAVRGAGERAERWGALIVTGIAGIAIGALFVVFPLLSTFTYTLLTVWLIALWAIVAGVSQAVAAIRMRREIANEWLLAASGALTALLGLALVWLAFASPAVTALSLGWVIGFWALVSGIALVALAFRLKRRED
ncbi:membrane protein [Novosphingobium marinum]|uniref:Uncharacterized membrane protein HdeD (DUF308 family) n=1 Tax=Novosphingobium marinum TaxID=1514948 RepID=A0A7Y9XVP2_9SPHN|nr:DUF308 domain-containing protein [Novosphingobium marinum]NYH95357.1 uncharacterized membrane protein HdeD (DUF308 family) [Novosphingobium marinum]GGC26393.1 membrane protein [Novosphingobium marinum]